METVSLKMEKNLLEEMDDRLKTNRYSTRTEFIRDAIREKLDLLEKKEIIRKLAAFKGKLKGKSRMSAEKARELAAREIAEGLGIELD